MLVISKIDHMPDRIYFDCPECESEISFSKGGNPPIVCEHCRTLLPDVEDFVEAGQTRKNYHLDSKGEFFS